MSRPSMRAATGGDCWRCSSTLWREPACWPRGSPPWKPPSERSRPRYGGTRRSSSRRDSSLRRSRKPEQAREPREVCRSVVGKLRGRPFREDLVLRVEGAALDLEDDGVLGE